MAVDKCSLLLFFTLLILPITSELRLSIKDKPWCLTLLEIYWNYFFLLEISGNLQSHQEIFFL